MNLKFSVVCLLFVFLLSALANDAKPDGGDKNADAKKEDKPKEGADAKKEAETGKNDGDKKAGPDAKPQGPKLSCNKDVIKSLGMKGLDKPREMELEMCPTVTMSCCELKDQLIIHDNWNNNDKPKLQSNLQAQYTIYDSLLLELVEIELGSKALLEKLKNAPESNCKVMAERIVEMNFSEQAKKLKPQIKSFHEFLITLHKGFLCATCDANNQKFINTSKNEIILSKSTCRDIVSKSFTFMIYFHVHLIKILNLAALYVTTCDPNGNFKEKAIPPELNISINPTNEKLLLDVRDNRDRSDWFGFFKNYCEKTSVTQFTDFFMPHLKQIEAFTKQIRGATKSIEAAVQTDGASPVGVKSAQSRLLDDSSSKKDDKKEEKKDKKDDKDKSGDKKDSKSKDKPEDDLKKEMNAAEKELDKEEKDKKKIVKKTKTSIYEPFEIYTVSLNAVIPLSEFKTVFNEPGINLYEIGISTTFETSLYEKIQKSKDDAGTDSSASDAKKKDGSSAHGAKEGSNAHIYTLMALIASFLLLI